MIQWEPIGAMKATGGLEKSNLQAYECFTIREPVYLMSSAISDRLRRRESVAFSTAC
jgi:hypothetical protein